MFTGIFTSPTSNIFDLGLIKIDFIILLLATILIFIIGKIEKKHDCFYSYLKKKNVLTKYSFYLLIVTTIIIFGIYGSTYNVSDFIYGSF